MRSFSTFSFHSVSFDPQTLIATFTYQFDEELFTETINFSTSVRKIRPNLDDTIIHTILKHLHIAVGISYYKLSPTADILVPNWRTSEMLQFRKTFYLNGLGEFMVVNGLSPNEICHFVNPSKPSSVELLQVSKPKGGAYLFPRTRRNNGNTLLFFGGGKDSLVSGELLKQQHKSFTLFSVGDNPLHALAASKVDAPRIIHTRILDPKLFEMNKSGERYNGHVPITGILSFLALFTAYLYGFDELILSNEKSANVGNMTLDGVEINHQWSKSEAFEKAFQSYLSKHLSQELTYYSLLRPRYEIRIVQEFCKYPQYFHAFSSCNRNFHLTGTHLTGKQLRCGKCPKCVFVYTMMRAFLPAETVNAIFEKNLFADEALLPLFRELLGIEGCKPFECVGTNEEMLVALKLVDERGFQTEEKALASLRTSLQSTLGTTTLEALQSKLLLH